MRRQSLIAPNKLIDPRSGVPFPIAARTNLPARPVAGSINHERIADEHHPATGRNALLAGTVATKALRYFRMQWALYEDHHHGYHDNRLNPMLPKTDCGIFVYGGMVTAGFIPDKFIDFQRSRSGLIPFVRRSSPPERGLMWERGDFTVENDAIVDKFFTTFVARRGVTQLHTVQDTELKKKFQSDPRRYGEPLVLRLVNLSIKKGGLPDVYAQARNSGLLPASAPRSAKEHVTHRLLHNMYVQDGSTGYEFGTESPRRIMLDALEQQVQTKILTQVFTGEAA